MFREISFVFLLASLLLGCAKVIPDEGFIEVEGGKIWYKKVASRCKICYSLLPFIKYQGVDKGCKAFISTDAFHASRHHQEILGIGKLQC